MGRVQIIGIGKNCFAPLLLSLSQPCYFVFSFSSHSMLTGLCSIARAKRAIENFGEIIGLNGSGFRGSVMVKDSFIPHSHFSGEQYAQRYGSLFRHIVGVFS